MMGIVRKGYVHVYTGGGKGKTTAAMGLALRSSGAGWKVYIQQFAKNKVCGEVKALRPVKNIKVSRCGNRAFIFKKPSVSDIECARKGMENARKNIFSGKYDLVIMDEINVAMKLGMVDVREIADIIRKRPGNVELVLTGRDCPAVIRKIADLVTEMREIKHPYRRGVLARRGIEY